MPRLTLNELSNTSGLKQQLLQQHFQLNYFLIKSEAYYQTFCVLNWATSVWSLRSNIFHSHVFKQYVLLSTGSPNGSSDLYVSMSSAITWITVVLPHNVERSWQKLLASYTIIQTLHIDITYTLVWMFGFTLLLHLLQPFHEMRQKTSMKLYFNK